MSNYKKHAMREFKAAGWLNEDGTFKDEMQEAICNGVLRLLNVFAEEGHSGLTAPYAVSLFAKLAKFEPIVPLTGDDWEWNDVGNGVFQNNRCFLVFKQAGRFDGKPYDTQAVVFYDWYTDEDGVKQKSHFTSARSCRVIEFPYTPTTVYEEAA